VRLASITPQRLRSLAPEASAFALIGLANTLAYFVIVNLTVGIGAVKAQVIATLITTATSYLANRHWTYRSRPKSKKRREYSLFFAFNMAGLVIQSGAVAVGEYGFGLTLRENRLWFNFFTCIGVGLATLFRFWAYRTLVFRPHPSDHAAPTGAAEALAEVLEEESEVDHLTGKLDDDLSRLEPPARSNSNN
jgi:putative flippase GtrA